VLLDDRVRGREPGALEHDDRLAILLSGELSDCDSVSHQVEWLVSRKASATSTPLPVRQCM
jgi:hypothetical protein